MTEEENGGNLIQVKDAQVTAPYAGAARQTLGLTRRPGRRGRGWAPRPLLKSAPVYGAGQLRAYEQSLNDSPSEANADGVASFTTPVPRSIWVGLPEAMVWVAPPEV